METAGAITPQTPVAQLPGSGAALAHQLRRLGITTARDLLLHLPRTYEREHAEQDVVEAKATLAADPRAILRIRGEIAAVRPISGRTHRVEATLAAAGATVRLVWFSSPWMARRIHPGASGIVTGHAKEFRGYLEFVNPRFEAGDSPPDSSDRLRPVYPATEEVASWRIERLLEYVLPGLSQELHDPLSSALRDRRSLPPLAEAIRAVHSPPSLPAADRARSRLAYDELLTLQLAIWMRRRQVRMRAKAVALPLSPAVMKRIRGRLPFALSAAQEHALSEITADIARTVPMNRLLQGDVGSGKTAVALCAMLAAVADGKQAALVAPTEILAEQHFATISAILKGSEVCVELLTGGKSGAGKARTLAALQEGKVQIAVGTHALLGEGVRFAALALAVVDEQHRFGVAQRASIRERSAQPLAPHVLVMTATPIPRTLSLAYMGDLDVSTMRGRLPGRTEVLTRVVGPDRTAVVYEYVRSRIEKGEQAYVVVPAVEESLRGLKDVASHAKALEEGPFRGLRVGRLHGRMKSAERIEAMGRFVRGEDQVLVSTVVIEVGVDVPNASLMVVEHAERFGLAQLHQLRGRIGRGTRASLCTFIGDPVTPDAQARLDAIGGTSDGFRIAELDLELRGPGDLLGARQWGIPPFRVADLPRDLPLLEAARDDAREWIERSPELGAPGEGTLRRDVLSKYGAALGLADVG